MLKATVQRELFLAHLTRVAAIANRKSTIPILGGVLLAVEGDSLTLVGTDLCAAFRADMLASSPSDGTIAVDAHDLLERIKTFPPGDVLLAATDASLLARSGSRKHTLRAMEGAAFPKVRRPVGETTIMPGGFLVDALRRTLPAADRSGRPTLAAVFLECAAGKLVTRAMDGHRLHAVDALIEGARVRRTMLPIAAAKELLGIPGGSNVTVSGDENEMFFTWGSCTYSVRTLHDPPPPYDNLLGVELPHKAVLERAPLVAAIKSIALAAGRDVTAGLLTFAFTKGALCISAKSEEGEGEDELPAEFEGAGSFMVYSTIMLDALGACEGEKINLSFAEELHLPVVLSPVVGGAFRALVMQARLT